MNIPLQLQSENFYFDDLKLIESFQVHPTTNSDLLIIETEDRQDIINITRAFANQILRFDIGYIVTCKKLKVQLVPPSQLQIVFGEILDSLNNFNPIENVKIAILEVTSFVFNLPEGLTFKLKEIKEHKISFELVRNQISKQFLKQMQEDVVSKARKEFLKSCLEEKDLDSEFMRFAKKFFGSEDNSIKMILQILVNDHVEKFKENIEKILNSFLDNIYLQVKENSFSYKIISQYSMNLLIGESLLVKTRYNERRNIVWMLDASCAALSES
ncbi:10882_t:CDS:1 [Acaulospora colombiana]|uniref:10882_t:CDS:1 n=1 Tax=Acaulospora colombiana TaxID=27376 RepID=A0ACA9M8T7_9GLOM|nr:10882_t:CDS:1 [Acaulospora colombiana]